MKTNHFPAALLLALSLAMTGSVRLHPLPNPADVTEHSAPTEISAPHHLRLQRDVS
jgi:hypothetical protein